MATAQMIASLSVTERHILDLWAAVLATGAGSVISHRSAGYLHGMADYGTASQGVVLSRASGRTSPDRYDGLIVQRAALPTRDVTVVGGLPVTTVERTAVDVAREGSLRAGVVAVDSALRLGATLADLERVLDGQRGWPGVRTARQSWLLGDVASESPLESLAHVFQFETGIDRPLTQVNVYDDDGLIGRVDDFWPAFATVGESDGMIKYEDSSALRFEKLRQERLERAGLQVVRVTNHDVTRDVVRTEARYRAAFDRGLRALNSHPRPRFTW